jgi:hypothetical protein
MRADLAIWDVDHPAELSYRIGFNPLQADFRRRIVTLTLLTPGHDAAELEQIWRSAVAGRLDASGPARRRGRRGAGSQGGRRRCAGLWRQHRLRQTGQRAHRPATRNSCSAT